jgi:hypothetical protein
LGFFLISDRLFLSRFRLMVRVCMKFTFDSVQLKSGILQQIGWRAHHWGCRV